MRLAILTIVTLTLLLSCAHFFLSKKEVAPETDIYQEIAPPVKLH
jgi:hypothetical protein